VSWKRLPFAKVSGTGNDFIIIDNRGGAVPEKEQQELTKKLCIRKFSVGADGIIFLKESSKADIGWDFYNADGSRADMCGNGARCAARFAHLNGMGDARISLETLAGIVNAKIVNEKSVSVTVQSPSSIQLDFPLSVENKSLEVSTVNTGVPHVVLDAKQVEGDDVKSLGRAIREHSEFKPDGANVSFITVLDRQNVRTTTYERGVEDFTLACGTGAMAVAVICHAKKLVDKPVHINVPGGKLIVNFDEENGTYKNLTLSGDARIIYEGELTREALFYEGEK